jgi:hypothetical protein
LNLEVLRRLTPKAFKFAKLFGKKDREWLRYSFLDFQPFLPIGWNISLTFKNSFEKQRIAACRFIKDMCANPRNVTTNRRGKLHFTAFKRVLQIQRFWG